MIGRLPQLLPVLLTAVVATTIVATPAAAAPSTDHEQIVPLTFPFAEGTSVRYGDDYDHCRRSSGGTCVRHHQSTDLMVAMGTPVHAAVAGRVSWRSGSASGPPSYGWMLNIAGDDGRTYAYVHLGAQDGPMSEAYARGTAPGDRVEAGQLIGWAGCSGTARCGGGEHLHFEIHDPRVTDPYDYHDHERINPYPSLRDAERRGAYPGRAHWVFRDVDPASTHGAAIAELADRGITKGCGSAGFCPDAVVTRQQMASFLVRALELTPRTGSGFDDVRSDNVHRRDIDTLARTGITKGCGPGIFCPGDPVTRAQMASFLVRGLDLPPARDAGFRDVAADDPHRADIAALAAAGITKGCGERAFCPDAPVTRAQMASFLVRALDR